MSIESARHWRTATIILALLLLGSLLLVLLHSRGLAESGDRDQLIAAQADPPGSDTGDLQGQIDALRQQLAASNAASLAAKTGTAAAARPSLAEAIAQAPQRNRKAIEALDAVYASTNADPAWAKPAEHRLKQLINEDIPATGGILPLEKSVSCKEEICRISTTFHSGDDTTLWIDAFLAGAAQDLPRTRIIPRINPDGSTTFFIYGVSEDRLGLLHANRPSSG